MCFEREQECFTWSSLNCDLPSIYNNSLIFISFYCSKQLQRSAMFKMREYILFDEQVPTLYLKKKHLVSWDLLQYGSRSLKNTICQRKLSNESVLHVMWPKIWSFSFSVSPSNEYSGLFSFRMDWVDLLAVQGTLKSLLQHHSSKASILQWSAFFIVQLSHPYMTTGKTIALTGQTFVGKIN